MPPLAFHHFNQRFGRVSTGYLAFFFNSKPLEFDGFMFSDGANFATSAKG